MMKSYRLGTIVAAISAAFVVVGISLAVNHQAGRPVRVTPVKVTTPAIAVPEIAGYRSWKQINAKPEYIMSKLDLLCTSPTPAQIAAEKSDPHVRHFMVCYVNKTGEHAMMHEKHPHFPVGSIIVKEKLDEPQLTAHISLVTGMIKRSPGFDPAHGDWEYVVCDGGNKKLEARGRLENCGGCHKEAKGSDYVFRGELGQSRLASLTK